MSSVNRKLALAFITIFILQFFVPLSMIIRREIVLRTGDEYLFRARPVDPADPFRGRYVALSFDLDTFAIDDFSQWSRGEDVFAVLEIDHEGFAIISRLSRKPLEEPNYLKARISYVSYDRVEGTAPKGMEQLTDYDGNTYYLTPKVRLDFPFDRYYMEEGDAIKAETLYNKRMRSEDGTSHVTVRIKNGFAVLEELYIDNQPVHQLI